MAISYSAPRSRRFFIGSLILCGALALPGAAAPDAALTAGIKKILETLGPHASSAVRVVSLDTGEVLFERNPDLSLNPASNMKLFTSAASLGILGPDYRFTTAVSRHGGEIVDGVLNGDLALVGGGDPVLVAADLGKLADAVRDAGLKRVTGRLVVDDTRYDAERLGAGWQWDDEPYYYSAQISALSVDRNVLRVDVQPGEQPGEPVRVVMRPVPDYLTIANRATTGAAGSTSRIDLSRKRGQNELVVSGSVPIGGMGLRNEEITMEEPALYAGALFRRLLEERGVTVEGATTAAPTNAEWKQVASHASPPLREIAAALNKPSDNLIAEMLLKELGYQRKQPGTAAEGGAAVRAWLEQLGIRATGFRAADGSGLSRMDLVTARVVSDLLIRIQKQPWRADFEKSLPVAGVDGTLRNRMKGTPGERTIIAKTGTLNRVTALGGYAGPAEKRRIAFSILINHYPGPTTGENGSKRVEDRIAILLSEWRPRNLSRK